MCVHFLHALRVYFLCHFYLPDINLIFSSIFRFSNEEGKQILRRRLIMKNNVRCMAALTCIESLARIAKILPTSGYFFFYLFSVSQLGGFLIDQIKFFCWAQKIWKMSLQRCYNISDVETALQQPYYSQLWQANFHFLLSSIVAFNWLLLSRIIPVRVPWTTL